MKTITISIQAASDLEATSKKASLQAIADNLTKENLAFIAEKAKTSGINDRISKFKNGPFKNAI